MDYFDLAAEHDEVRAQNDELETLATTDSLTGLLNRQKLESILRERFATSRVFFWMVPVIASGRLA